MVKIFLSPVNIVTNYVTNSSQCSLHISPLPPEQKITKKKEKNIKIMNYGTLWSLNHLSGLFLSRISFKETVFKQFTVKNILHI